MSKDKWISAGGVVLDGLEEPHRVYVVKPSNNYGPWCFPKGRVDEGETLHAAALREVREEAGISANIIPGGNLGTGVGSYSITHYFLMLKEGELGAHDNETEEVRVLELDEAEQLLAASGNSRDVGILNKARAHLDKQHKEKVTEVDTPNKKICSNLLENIFIATCAAAMLGRSTDIKLRGTKEEIAAITNMTSAASCFKEELSRPEATVNSILQKLSEKQKAVNEFKRIFNTSWLF